MQARRILTALGVLALALVAGVLFWTQDSALGESAVSEEWVARYDGTGGLRDGAWALAVDGAGNVYVTGISVRYGVHCADLPETCEDYATVKYAPDGSEEWVARYDGPAGLYDAGYDVAVDGSGNVYVTGASTGSVSHWDYATIKYAPDGSEEWVARYDGPASEYDEAHDVAADGSGNVYVTGISDGSGTEEDYVTIKYGPDGSEEWVARYDGPASQNDWARALAVDGEGNVYVTGISPGSGSHTDYATIKYGPDGSEEWVARYDGPASQYDYANDLAVDASGNVYVTGRSEGDYVTIEYAPDGSEEWVARYNGPAGYYDSADALALDAAGNVYVTGHSYCDSSGTDRDYVTIKYAPDGSEEWVARYDGPASELSHDYAYAVAVDGEDNVYVTGESRGLDTSVDYTTIKYGPAGSERWVARYDGPTSGRDYAYDLMVDGSGNVYITGKSGGPGMEADYATIKYGPAPDKDGDGCTAQQEFGSDPTQGGLRDPTSFWDYGDMPDPNADPQRDKLIRVTDIMAVVYRYGTDDEDGTAEINRNTAPLSTPPKTGYHPAYDRGGQVGPNPWDQAPADGQIRVADIMAVVYQYGHDCA